MDSTSSSTRAGEDDGAAERRDGALPAAAWVPGLVILVIAIVLAFDLAG